MELLREIREGIRSLHPLCRKAARLMVIVSALYLLIALIVYFVAPLFPDYFRSMLIFREGIKAAVTSLLIATIIIVIGGRMLGSEDRGQ